MNGISVRTLYTEQTCANSGKRTSIEMKKQGNKKDSMAFDPPISMTDDGGRSYIRIDLPGVPEEKIRIDLEKTTFTVSVSGDENALRKAIWVPEGVRIFKKKFSDGVLEIILEKPAS
jgi:HSP20 family molecular chaperone IbpA